MNLTTLPTTTHRQIPQEVLYLPSIIVATAMIVFLGVSFVRYHQRIIEKKAYSREYARQHLNVKRDRIRGHITSLNAPRIFPHENAGTFCFQSLYLPSEQTFPEDDDNITIVNNKSIYMKKPQTPKSYFDNEGYEEEGNVSKRQQFFRNESYSPNQWNICSEECSRPHSAFEDEDVFEPTLTVPGNVRIVTSGSASEKETHITIPMSQLCQDCIKHLPVNRPTYSVEENCRDEDAFHESHLRPKPERKKSENEEVKTRKKSLQSRTFPDAKIKIGAIELGS